MLLVGLQEWHLACNEWWDWCGAHVLLQQAADFVYGPEFHCHSLSLALGKSRLVLPFRYRLTWVVLDGLLNGHCCCHFT